MYLVVGLLVIVLLVSISQIILMLLPISGCLRRIFPYPIANRLWSLYCKIRDKKTFLLIHLSVIPLLGVSIDHNWCCIIIVGVGSCGAFLTNYISCFSNLFPGSLTKYLLFPLTFMGNLNFSQCLYPWTTFKIRRYTFNVDEIL